MNLEQDILLGIVSYNPNIQTLCQSLETILSQCDVKIVIVDNGSANIQEIESHCNNMCKIIRNSTNFGIAYALNKIGIEANRGAYKYFLTLDQDSIIGNLFFSTIKELIESSVFDNEDIGIICPFIERNGDFIKSDKMYFTQSAITSGSLVVTECWKRIGGFWNFLFIDEVDHEFCYRMRQNGYKILKSDSYCIHHVIGEPDNNRKKVLGHEFNPTNHSPFRRYYMTRNSIIMLYLYPKEKDPFPHRIQMMLRIFVSITFCEKEKVQKYKAMVNGISDALKWILTYKRSNNIPGKDIT